MRPAWPLFVEGFASRVPEKLFRRISYLRAIKGLFTMFRAATSAAHRQKMPGIRWKIFG
jgi:hypothetical protein